MYFNPLTSPAAVSLWLWADRGGVWVIRTRQASRSLTRVAKLFLSCRVRQRFFLFTIAAVAASGCVDVDELLEVNADGSGSVTLSFRYDPMYGTAADELLTHVRTPWKVSTDKLLPNSGRLIVIARSFSALSELTAKEMGRDYSLVTRSTGLFRRRLELTIRQRQRYDWPIQHITRVRLPGRVEETNRIQDGAEIVWHAKPPAPGDKLIAITSAWAVPSREAFDAWFNGWYLRETPIVVLEDRVLEVEASGKERELTRVPSGWQVSDLEGTCVLLHRPDSDQPAYLDSANGWILRELPVPQAGAQAVSRLSPDGRFIGWTTSDFDPQGRSKDTGVFLFDRRTETMQRVDEEIPTSRLAQQEASALPGHATFRPTRISWPAGAPGVLLFRSSTGTIGNRWLMSWDLALQDDDFWVLLRDAVPSMPNGVILGVGPDRLLLLFRSTPERLVQIDRVSGRQSEIIRAPEGEALLVAVAPNLARLVATTHAYRDDSDQAPDSFLRVLESGSDWSVRIAELFPKKQLSQFRWNEAGDQLLLLATNNANGEDGGSPTLYRVDAVAGTVAPLFEGAGTIGWLWVTRGALTLGYARVGFLSLVGVLMLLCTVGGSLGARLLVRNAAARPRSRRPRRARTELTCPSCTSHNAAGSRYCASCGTLLSRG